MPIKNNATATNKLIELVKNYHYDTFRRHFKSITKHINQNAADITATDENGYTALDWAIRRGHIDVAELLAQKHPNYTNNVAGIIGQTKIEREKINAFIDAAQMGDLNTITNYITGGIDIDATDTSKEGRTALCFAVASGNIDTINLLLKRGARQDIFMHSDIATTLSLAIRKNDENILRILCDALPSSENTIYVVLDGLKTAFEHGTSTIVWYLLNAIAGNTDLCNEALFLTSFSRNKPYEEIRAYVSYLLQNGANIDTKGKAGQTPLFDAIARNNINSADALLDLGANRIDAINFALENEEEDGLEFIANYFNNGFSCYAALAASLDRIDADNSNADDNTIISNIRQNKLLLTKELVCLAKCYAQSANSFFNDAELTKEDLDTYKTLLFAIKINSNRVVNYLLSKGANPYIRNANGISAMQLAIQSKNAEIIQTLKNFPDNEHILKNETNMPTETLQTPTMFFAQPNTNNNQQTNNNLEDQNPGNNDQNNNQQFQP